jgi:hypothetical protein
MVWRAGKWRPGDTDAAHPIHHSVPEEAFRGYVGIGQHPKILTYVMEPLPAPWIPYVTGHARAYGVELSLEPRQIGCTVRLSTAPATSRGGDDDPELGDLIARGHGTNASWTMIFPHASTDDDPDGAITPNKGLRIVPAGHRATITVHLVNDGLIGAYIFPKRGAQLSVMAVPLAKAGAARWTAIKAPPPADMPASYRHDYRTVVPLEPDADRELALWLARESFERTAAGDGLTIIDDTFAWREVDLAEFPAEAVAKTGSQLGRPAEAFTWVEYTGTARYA